MLGSPNLDQGNVPLAMRLKIHDLHAQLAPLERYGVGGMSFAMTGAIQALARFVVGALRGAFSCGAVIGAMPRPSDRAPHRVHLRSRLSAVILSIAFEHCVR
jgi:hypothetical protein